MFACLALASDRPAAADQASYAQVKQVLQQKCVKCHGAEVQKADVRLDELSTDLVADARGAETWHDALNAINKGEMPPEDEVPLTADERRVLTGWINGQLQRLKKARKATSGQVVLRRLNRFEYQNTMTDLLGVDLDYTANLPPDPISEDGFSNNGAALQMSALQLEYYLKAARAGLQRAIVEGPSPEVFAHSATETVADKGKGNYTNRLGRTGQFVARIPKFPDEGEFLLRIKAHAEIPDGAAYPIMQVTLGYRSDVRAPSKIVGRVDVSHEESQDFEFRARFEEFPIQTRTQSKYPGMLVWLENIYSNGQPAPPPVASEEPVAKGEKKKKKKQKLVYQEDPAFPRIVIEEISFTAPVFVSWPPKYHTDIIPRIPSSTEDERAAARDALTAFLPRAFRRPVTEPDLETHLKYFDIVRPTSESFEATMREVFAMALVSPDFLYITEPQDDGRKLNDFELAARLSCFLWSTMPDTKLFEAAANAELRNRSTLLQQVDRMLADDKSEAFVEQFTNQWLDLSGIDRVAVNPEFYPDFDESLKPHLQQETQQFFAEILRTNTSAIQLLDADFAMLNEPLARHYGIAGPRGTTFEPVRLPAGNQRGGLLGQGSILLANSTGDDSHPIKRAVWIRERLLDDPPAPPPPDVPNLNQDLPEIASLPLKEQLRLHLENEACADCHRGIDPWGVALDGFDAVGLQRDVIRRRNPKKRNQMLEHPVETSVELPDGTRIDGLQELKTYLADHKSEEFARTVVVKLLTYALGRSLEFTDEETVDRLTAEFKTSGYRLRHLIAEIICSDAFGE